MYNYNIYLSLYKMIYNDNKYFLLYMKLYFNCTRRCIIAIFCCHYIREYIMTTNISLIHEIVFLIIQDDV